VNDYDYISLIAQPNLSFDTHYIARFHVNPNRLLMAAEMLKTKEPKKRRFTI